MGRPAKKLTPKQIDEVETLAAVLTQDQIADYFGMARNTFSAVMDRQPEVSARYKMGKANAISDVGGGLLMRARQGDNTAAIFYLKTQAGWKETDRHELAGHDGQALAFDGWAIGRAKPDSD